MAARLFARARREWEQQQFDAAGQSLANVLALEPDELDAIRMLGMVEQRRGNHAKAIDCFRRILSTWPDDPSLHTGLGLSLFERAEFEDATAHLRLACKLAPASASAWFNLGEALWRQASSEEALRTLQRALALDPGHVSARLSLARVQASLGQITAAVAGFREVLRRVPRHADAWYGLSLNAAGLDSADTAHLQKLFAREDLPARDHELIGFTLAKALEDQGAYAQAFDVLRTANASQRVRVKWDAAGERTRVEAILRVFANGVPRPLDEQLGHEAILVVSMPRSGSTLVEQILASHPDVEGANEIKDLRQVVETETQDRGSAFPLWVPDATQEDWQRLGHAYLSRTGRWRRTRPRFTDKSLMNWQLVGAALAMLPAARVIVVRRDPVETCLACYRQCFTEEAGFTCDLDDTADYCIDFLRLTRFWLATSPDRVFDLQYEELLAEPEAMIRRLLDFCELPFHSACLEFYNTPRAVLTPSAAQVRQPFRRDTARSTRYGDKLDRVRQRLRNAGAATA